MNYEKTIPKLFNYLYNKVYKGNVQLELTESDHKLIHSFKNLLLGQFPTLESVGYRYLITYFAFAFNFYSTVKRTNKFNIKLNWIIGKKMFGRFLQKKDVQDFYVRKFLKEYNIDLNVLISKLAEEDIIDRGLDPSEELEKLRHFGEAQLYHCTCFTTLYNHRSTNCLACPNKSACKKILKQVNPVLYSKRGYK